MKVLTALSTNRSPSISSKAFGCPIRDPDPAAKIKIATIATLYDMREIIEEILPIFTSDTNFTIATVTRTWSSAPRPVGAAMAVSPTGEVVGSVSGGCVEGAIHETSLEVLKTGIPQSVTYGVSDDNAFSVGLTCGGTIELFIQLVNKETFADFDAVARNIKEEVPVGIATLISAELGSEHLGSRIVITKDGSSGSLGNPELDHSVIEDARGLLEQGKTKTSFFFLKVNVRV
jgi:xanthine dehydrogenase accessory factor